MISIEKGTACLVITEVNRRYITGFPSSDGYLLMTEGNNIFIVDGRYIEAAKEKAKNCEVVLLKSLKEQLNFYKKKYNIEKIFTEDEISIKELNCIRKLFNCEIVSDNTLSAKLLEMRSQKSGEEVEYIIKAQRIAEKALEETLEYIKPGVSEKRVATELEYRMSLLGSEGVSFETIVVSGKKSSMPHGVPDEKRIEAGDFVTIDFGATYKGYHSDMTRTFAVGFATEEMKKVYETVLFANISVEKSIKSLLSFKEADKIARNVIENAGYGKYFTHSTGHGVGLEIHEYPNLSPKSEGKLKVSQIVTDEPGIYIEGKFGVRIEDMLCITENGAKNLTQFDKKMLIL